MRSNREVLDCALQIDCAFTNRSRSRKIATNSPNQETPAARRDGLGDDFAR
ncbi:MAG: hypothetical protein CLLPBCKN_001780 [Chroococcidiopsis cubana SAG 39.79]|jgi:hypothetical protein|nr:hypothetical protein [Chroococcidiopsis cubana SAG 39.79]